MALRHRHLLFPLALSAKLNRLFNANDLKTLVNHHLPDSVQAIKFEMAKQSLGSFYSPNMNRECRKMFHSICNSEKYVIKKLIFEWKFHIFPHSTHLESSSFWFRCNSANSCGWNSIQFQSAFSSEFNNTKWADFFNKRNFWFVSRISKLFKK